MVLKKNTMLNKALLERNNNNFLGENIFLKIHTSFYCLQANDIADLICSDEGGKLWKWGFSANFNKNAR